MGSSREDEALSRGGRAITSFCMRPVATVAALGPFSARAAATLDSIALASDVLVMSSSFWSTLKQRTAGSFALLLLDDAEDAALYAAGEAAKILRRLGSGRAVVVAPAGTLDLARIAAALQACVLQPADGASQADVVRGFVEPLSIFGLVGVKPRDFRALAAPGRCGRVYPWEHPAPMSAALDEALRGPLREVLLSYRMRPAATLREVDDAARQVSARTPARLVFAGPELAADEGPRAIATLMLR